MQPRVLVLLLLLSSVTSASTFYAPAKEMKSIEGLFIEAYKHVVTNDKQSAVETLLRAVKRLTLFEIAYGARVESLKSFSRIKARAKLLYRGLLPFKQTKSRLVPRNKALFFLMELSQKATELDKALDEIEPTTIWDSERADAFQEIYRFRSTIYQLRGKYSDALQALRDAFEQTHTSIPSDRDLMELRLGWLFLKSGKAADGLDVLQRVVDIFPKTASSKYAYQILIAKKSYKQPTTVKFRQYIAGRYPSDAILAFAEHKLQGSLDLLSEILGKSEGKRRRDVIHALGVLSDNLAIPLLERVLKDGPDYQMIDAAFALARLGERQYLPHLLKLWEDDKKVIEPSFLQAALLKAFPSGPKIDFKDGESHQSLSMLWNRWYLESMPGRRRSEGPLRPHNPVTHYKKPIIGIEYIDSYLKRPEFDEF